MKSLYLITLIGAIVTGLAYFAMGPATMKKMRRNLFVGGTFSRLLVKQYLRKMGFAR